MNMRLAVFLLSLISLAACDSPSDTNRIVGQLESDRVELTAEFSETIVERMVVEGQQVSKGASIIQQDPARAAARVREAEALLTQNQARLAELIRGPRKEQIIAAQASVDGAVQELDFRQTELRRIQELLDRKLSSPGEHDRAKAALDGAESSLDINRAKLAELLTGTTVEELDQARAAVKQRQAQLDRLQIDLDRLLTTAPADGVIDSLLFEPGERPAPGQPMAILLSGEQPYARVYVPEALRVAIRPGTTARIYVDGITEPFDGQVRWVASEASFTPYFALTEHDRGRLAFLAKVDIEVAGKRLPDGVPVEVELLVPTGGAQ
jgi:HlyD family secretion protein